MSIPPLEGIIHRLSKRPRAEDRLMPHMPQGADRDQRLEHLGAECTKQSHSSLVLPPVLSFLGASCAAWLCPAAADRGSRARFGAFLGFLSWNCVWARGGSRQDDTATFLSISCCDCARSHYLAIHAIVVPSQEIAQ